MSAPFGKSRLAGESKRTYAKLKDGDQQFRILPAMGDLAEEGRWSVFHAIHYGYKNTKGQMRTFGSPEKKNNKTRMVEVADAALDRINDLTARLEKAKAEGNTEMVERLRKLVGRGKNDKAQYNLDKNHYINALDTSGNIVVLKLRHKAKKALEEAIKKVRNEDGVDPLAAETGRYFNFSRSGTGMDTLVQVTVGQNVEDVGGRKVKVDMVHVIDDALINRLLKNKNGVWEFNEAVNLSTLFPYPTADEVARIVKEGSKAVDEILDREGVSAAADDSDLDQEETAPVAEAPKAVPAPAVAVTAPKAPVAAPVTPTAPPIAAKAPVAAASAISEMSEEDFLNSLNNL